MPNEIQNNKLLLLGKMAAGLAHEIRNPLSAIKLNLNYLGMIDGETANESRECIGSALEAVERIQQLIDSTLEFSRTKHKTSVSCSINSVVNEAVNFMTSTAHKKNVNIEIHLDENLPELKIHKNKLLQVFSNLITNAIEASSKSDIIKIRSYMDNERNIVLAVEDTGIGIKQEDQHKIFEEFFTSKQNGTGIGLSVCKRILEEYDAEIHFTSAEGVGTTFNIVFPKNSFE
ncbi:MAG: ATP-binding protein [bacterium]